MTLSNRTKGATKSIIEQVFVSIATEDTVMTQMRDIINDLSEYSHLSKTEALEVVSLLINSIKTHLIEGRSVNLNELGTFTLHVNDHNLPQETPTTPHRIKVNFEPCATLEKEVNEKIRYRQHSKL